MSRVTRLTDDECRELVAEWDLWAEREYHYGIPYSELWRRSKEAREHPETLVSHEEVMRGLRKRCTQILRAGQGREMSFGDGMTPPDEKELDELLMGTHGLLIRSAWERGKMGQSEGVSSATMRSFAHRIAEITLTPEEAVHILHGSYFAGNRTCARCQAIDAKLRKIAEEGKPQTVAHWDGTLYERVEEGK